MILFLLLYCLSQPSSFDALPLPLLPPHSNEQAAIVLRQIKFTERSQSHIIWGCLTTLFACTWVAVHPDIPHPSDGCWRIFGRRLKIMGYTLLAPEIIIFWAARQWCEAAHIAEKHKARGWTRAHGFFTIMGGFMLYKDGDMLQTLDISDLETLETAGEIQWPTISEKEIYDRSKGDLLTKGFVVLQTSWFIAQCMSRGIYRLVLTELEIVTLAFAALNGIMYFLWWSKPLDVQCTMAVHLHQITPSYPSKTISPLNKSVRSAMDLNNDTSTQSQLSNTPANTAQHQKVFTSIRNGISTVRNVLAYIFLIKAATALFSSLLDMIQSQSASKTALRIPLFYSSRPTKVKSRGVPIFVSLGVGTVFGAIHCVAWSFEFISKVEEQIWRYSSATITVFPLLFVLGGVFMVPKETTPRWGRVIYDIVIFMWMLGTLLYVTSRIALLILPFLALRSLATGAFVDFDWSAMFPHL